MTCHRIFGHWIIHHAGPWRRREGGEVTPVIGWRLLPCAHGTKCIGIVSGTFRNTALQLAGNASFSWSLNWNGINPSASVKKKVFCSTMNNALLLEFLLHPTRQAFGWGQWFRRTLYWWWRLVIFFLKRARSVLDNLDSSIVGKVLAAAHVACYLYVVRGNATCIRLLGIIVKLEILEDDHTRSLCHEIPQLVGKYGCREKGPLICRPGFHLVVIWACALAVFGTG